MQSDFDINNPYQSPTAAGSAPVPTELQLAHALRNYQTQIVALGVSWVLLGSACACCFFVPLSGDGPSAFFFKIILFAIAIWGLIVVAIGICTCMKVLYAVYAGLGLVCLTILGSFSLFPICGVVLTVIGILQALQAWRIVRWAMQLKVAGVSLNSKPEDLLRYNE